MFSVNTEVSSSLSGVAPSPRNSAECTETSAAAARPCAERVLNNATSARTEPSVSTRAAIGIARGVSPAPETAGW